MPNSGWSANPSPSSTPLQRRIRITPKCFCSGSIISCIANPGRRALTVSRKLCRVAPDCGAGFLHAGFCLNQLGKTAEALKVLLRGPSTLRREPIYYYNMGCYEALLGNARVAQKHLKISFEMDASFRAIAKTDPDLKAVQALLEALPASV